jgi:hypothetical protein
MTMAKGGWSHSAEAKAKISRSLKGKPLSAATRKKLSAAHKKRQALIRQLMADYGANAAA